MNALLVIYLLLMAFGHAYGVVVGAKGKNTLGVLINAVLLSVTMLLLVGRL